MRTTHISATASGPVAPGSSSPQRIRWGAVFAGAVFGIALLALLTTLWLALAYGSEIDEVRENLEWFVGASAIVCLFVAGLLAGWLSGVRGAGSGFFNGVTIWALMLLLTISVGVPAILDVVVPGRLSLVDPASGGVLDPNANAVLWATLSAILGGLVASGLGGAIGGAITRPANAHLAEETVAEPDEIVARRSRPDVGRRTAVVIPEPENEESRLRQRVGS
jgi:hypothetical protein